MQPWLPGWGVRVVRQGMPTEKPGALSDGRSGNAAKGGKWLNPFCTDIDGFSTQLS